MQISSQTWKLYFSKRALVECEKYNFQQDLAELIRYIYSYKLQFIKLSKRKEKIMKHLIDITDLNVEEINDLIKNIAIITIITIAIVIIFFILTSPFS